MAGMNDFEAVRGYLTDLQDRICAAMETADGAARFHEDAWTRPDESADGRWNGVPDYPILRLAVAVEHVFVWESLDARRFSNRESSRLTGM